MEYLVLGVVLVLVGAGSADICTDIDTIACHLLHAKQSNLCQDPMLHMACKRYCGQCPIVCNSCPQLVLDPRECNGTVTCGLGEVCFMMEVTNFDHIHGFRGGCIKKDLCVLDHQAILLGRRSNSNMKIYCCTEENCNNQVFSTDLTTAEMITAVPTTTTAMTTTVPYHIVTNHCVDDPGHNCREHRLCGEQSHQLHCRHACGLCCKYT